MSDAVLNVTDLSQIFGGLAAASEVNLHVDENEIVGMIGPNGAGKTTVFNCITGMYTPTKGKIEICGVEVKMFRPDLITAMGVSRTFQNLRLFAQMSVLENVMMARHLHLKANLIDVFFNTKKYRGESLETEKKALEYLDILNLSQYRYNLASDLPYGAQKRLEIARALATEPKLLLLDEPAAGMNEIETAELREMVRKLSDLGYTIFLIEHDMKFVMNICDRIYVLNSGMIIAEGTPAEIKANPKVIEAYLGVEEGD